MADTNNIQLGERNYESLFYTLKAWRRAAGRSDTIAGGFNRFDNPSTLYFRIFFDFTKGLLGPVSDVIKNNTLNDDAFTDELWKSSRAPIGGSALNYLLLNNEWERANALKDFINLLSNISVNSPWYFSQIEGVGDLLERSEFTGESFSIPEVKPISIKCLPDSYDNRIGTLLDLYREACYSWQLHKEIIPANLRRFDMYIYIFSTPIRGIHAKHQLDSNHITSRNLKNNDGVKTQKVGATLGESVYEDIGDSVNNPNDPNKHFSGPTDFATFDQNTLAVDDKTGNVTIGGDRYLTSSKLIQLLDCEFDVNAVKSGYGSLDNQEGFQQIYTIPIKVNIAMEQRYNELLMKRLGDFVVRDMDLPGNNGDRSGELRDDKNITEETADKRLTVNYTTTQSPAHNNRLDNDNLSTGHVNPERNVPQINYDKTAPITVNRSKSGFSQAIQAGKSAIDSWTDIDRLSKSIERGVESQIKQLVWGNLFETNIQNLSTEAMNIFSKISSNNLFENTVNGWTHTRSKRESSPANSIGENLGELQFNLPNIKDPIQGSLFES